MDPQSLLPAPPRTQALSSRTFSIPPLDGSLTLPEIYDWHAKNSPNHRLFVFSRDDGDVRTILWSEAVRAIHNGARLVRGVMGWESGMKDAPVVAILASSDTITYFTTIMSILRAGYIAFPISPRNSPEAVAHLVNAASVKHIFVGREKALSDLNAASLKVLESLYSNTSRPTFSPAPVFEELFVKKSHDFDEIPFEKKSLGDVVMYMHSSGSTAFPKAVPWTNRYLNELALHPYFGERDLTDLVFSLHSIPMYHGMGSIQLTWAASCGLVIAAFEPKFPAQIPTPERHFQAAVASKSDVIYCVPAIIEAWSRVPEYVDWLSTRKGVLFGGGPLNKTVGDNLTSHGVSIFNLYGLTEGGIVSPVLAADVGYDWDYFKIPGNVVPSMIPQGNGTYELVLIANPYSRPSIINSKVDGVDAYSTADLFTEHPEKPGYWRIYGRTDDQIMHSTGEKTNPGPLENMLNQDVHVQSSVMFGRGQFQAGVLIDPKQEFKFDPADEAKLACFRNQIWPTVKGMNKFAPQHSRLFKEMIIVSKPSKPFQYTAKSTARRQTIINDYAGEIEAAYHAVTESTQSTVPPPAAWDSVAILQVETPQCMNKLVSANSTNVSMPTV